MSNEKINSVEKRVVELKFIERDIIKQREHARFPLLKNAEKCQRIDNLIKSFFIKLMNIETKNLNVTAYPSSYKGRDDEEFLSEIKVDISYKPETSGDYSEIILSVFLTDGFEDSEVRESERKMMDRLFEIRESIEKLREEKRQLKSRG